jgi:hypothetical protein
MPRLTLSYMSIALLSLPSSAGAQLSAPPALPSVSSGPELDELSQSRTKLMAQLEAVGTDIASLRQRCGHVATTDLALMADCEKFQTAVRQEIDDYRSALASYESETSVVDARKVPSGLPKFVDEAIASGYSTAPPGVSDRVRKGFQAVAAHDWKAARAWFADALNHDPENAGLKRLAELADYTQKRIERDTAVNNGHPSSGAIQLPEVSDIQFLFPPDPLAAQRAAPMQMPKDSDLDLLFPGLPAIEARELDDYVTQQVMTSIENDPVMVKSGNPPAPRSPHN